MALFVARHQHPAERCPAADPAMGQMLLAHLAPENAAKFGIDIHGDAVINDSHTFYLIVDAPDRASVETFMAPFAQAGSVEVLGASTCEAVVSRGGCGLAVA
ncbi:MAG TPA: DUF3303 family protein [Ktedonobacterales bacterium]|nr:DUF3303 family protein [Ktedonobacterales bacterium]